MRVIISAAGTGGHINPGIAIANKIKEKEPDSEIVFFGTNRGLENDLVPRAGYKLKRIEAYGLKKELSIKNIKHILQTIHSKKEVTASPIVQEVYFRHKYSEIDDPVKIGRDLEKNRNKEQEIAVKDSSEVTTAKENLTFTEQEIGKATINTPTIDKDNAKNREKQDEKEIQQTKDVQSQLE